MGSFKELRKKTSLSQNKFAESFGIPLRTLQQWEQGISSPPPYVYDMLSREVQAFTNSLNESDRHFIPKKSSWKICIDKPFENCEKIYPIQQGKVRALIDDITSHHSVNEIIVFGSSVTEGCHIGSDVDIFVDADDCENLISGSHGFEYDLWTMDTVDSRLLNEIRNKGVKVYG